MILTTGTPVNPFCGMYKPSVFIIIIIMSDKQCWSVSPGLKLDID